MGNPNSQGSFTHLALPKHVLIVLLRLFFYLLYHQFAWTYDLVAFIVSTGAWQSWVKSVLPYLKGPRTLEIGFGPGHLLLKLQQESVAAFGLDESSQMAHIARRRILAINQHPNLIRGRAEYLPFATESLHQVVMTFPAEFLLKQTTFSEIKRVLLSGGSAIVLPIAWITGRKPWERAAAWLNQITGQAPEWDERLLQPLKNLGFDITWKMVDFASSRVLIVQLTKTS